MSEPNHDWPQDINELLAKGCFADAKTFALNKLNETRVINGPESCEHARAMEWLGYVHYASEEYEPALTQFQRAAESYKRLSGEESEEFAVCLSCIGRVYFDNGNLDAAAPLFRQSANIMEKTAPDSWGALLSFTNLSRLHLRLKEFDCAEKYAMRALKLRAYGFGKSNPRYTIDLLNLSDIYRSTQRFRAAETLIRKAMSIHELAQILDREYANAQLRLASLYKELGRLDEAIYFYERGLETLATVRRGDHRIARQARQHLAATRTNLVESRRHEQGDIADN